MSIGKVYIIGAGCGEYDLITLKGMELLKKSEVIVYDSLIDERILGFADINSERICVGKRAGKPSESQENINRLLIENALQGKTVARLKGGDPFVFGRGGEEILSLKEHDIPFEVVPGITSAAAVPELAGIPVTHRSVSRSFHVITGHTKEDRLPSEMSAYAKLSGTLVFLMGLGSLKDIADALVRYGKSKGTPAAVVSNGGRAEQKVIRGTLEDIAQKSDENKMVSPAVIVVGETAAYDLCSCSNDSLKGISVTVTGTKRFSDRLALKLENCGAAVLRENKMKVESCIDSDDFTSAINRLSGFSMVVLTSPNGAEIFMQKIRAIKTDVRRLSHIRFAVIGNATAEVLGSHGIYADIIPEEYTSAALGEAIVRSAGDNENVLILRAIQGTPELTEILRRNHIIYEEVKIYDVLGDKNNIPSEVKTDFIVFASGSGAREFYRQGYSISSGTKAVCIGNATAAELKRISGINAVTPEIQSSDSIVELIKRLKG